ncbi:MAG TPA: two-component regulator propeller domain-containing protein [Candidatus Angelobacter sp.]|nr:two-component regulator propeller domain-containing protein [Candidatus Angelobacter sp.]
MKTFYSCVHWSVLLILAGLFSFASVAEALDPHKAITQYIHTVWGADNGLPNGNSMVMAQTGDGYLWVGTFSGLFRFDGITFTFFDEQTAPGMKQAAGIGVKALYAGKDGSLWVGTNGRGLVHLKNGIFTIYTTNEGLSDNTIRSIIEGHDGSLWIATDLGLDRLQNGKFTIYGSGDGLTSNSIRIVHEDRSGILWVGSEIAIDRFKDGKFTRFLLNLPGSEKDQKPVTAIEESGDGSVWIGLFGGGVVRVLDGRQTVFTTHEGLSNDYVHSILQDRDGNVWIGTVGGLNRLTENQFSAYTMKDGLPQNNVFGIFEDREGNLWAGVDSTSALNRFRDGKFLTYTTQEGLSGDSVYSVWQRKDGSIWVGTDGGLSEFDHGKFTTYTDKLLNNRVTAVLESRDGSLWIGTSGSGLGRLKNDHLTMYTRRDGLANDQVWCLAEDKEGNVWIGTNDGLNRFQHEKLTSYSLNEGLPSQMIRMLGVDREGNLWIGGNSGLTQFKGGMFKTYSSKDGMSSDSPRAFYADAQGVLWIGTMGAGLNRMKDGHFTVVTARQGLFEDHIMDIQEDAHGNMWLSGQKGISRVNKKQLEDVADGKTTSVSSTGYGRADGMRAGVASGTMPNVCKAADGKLWVPTFSGIVVIDPDHIRADNLMPGVVIEQVLIDRKQVEINQPIAQTAHKGELEFHYTAPSFTMPERVKFKYKLEGFDEDWVDVGTRRAAYYTNIPPGSYRFRVMTSNSDGVWNVADASFSFQLTIQSDQPVDSMEW